MSTTSSRHRRPTLAALTLALGLAIAAPLATSAQAVLVTVQPTSIAPGTTTLTVTGSGFSPAGNGIYVVFGPITEAPVYYSDPSIYGAFKWVHVGAGESSAEAPLATDGSFSTTLDVASTFTTPAGDIDCAVTACAVVTFAAHGSPDRSQDTCVALAVGDVMSSASPAPSASLDPCAPITAGAAPSVAPGGSPAASPVVSAGVSAAP
jgi:hypothetical protein